MGNGLDKVAVVVGPRLGVAVVATQLRAQVTLVVAESERVGRELGRLFERLYRETSHTAVAVEARKGEAWNVAVRQGVDGIVAERPPGIGHPVWSTQSKVRWVLSLDARKGKTGPDWSVRRGQLRHSHSGGVTNGTERATVWIRNGTKGAAQLLASMPPALDRTRDVYSVCDDLVGGVTASRPTAGHHALPECAPVTDGEISGYEGHGLVPVGEINTAVVRVPSVMSPTKWVHRKLERSERLGVIDVPKIWIEDMSKELQDALERKHVLALGVLGAAQMAARGLGEATSTDPMGGGNTQADTGKEEERRGAAPQAAGGYSGREGRRKVCKGHKERRRGHGHVALGQAVGPGVQLRWV